MEYVYITKGCVKNKILYSGYTQYVEGSGSTKNIKVYSGATQSVFSGGMVTSTTVYKGGFLSLNGGKAKNIVVNSGGNLQGTANKIDNLFAKKGSFIGYGGKQINNFNLMGSATLRNVNISNFNVSYGGSAKIYQSTLSGNIVVNGGRLNLGTNNEYISLKNNSILNLKSNSDLSGSHLKIANVTLKVTGYNNIVGSIYEMPKLSVLMNNKTKIIYDIRNLKPNKSSPMLTLMNEQKTCNYIINLKILQLFGTYKLSKYLEQKNNQKYIIKINNKNIGTIKLNNASDVFTTIKGVKYKLRTSDCVELVIQNVPGDFIKASNKSNKITGSKNCDIFYGNKNSNIFDGINGRDVAVYDKKNWGKDIIKKTNGTMTLLFKDLKKSDIVQNINNQTMTITKKGNSNQKILIQGWNNSTHNIVFATNMNSLTKYLNTSTPTDSQKKAARTEVWKKAGLAST